MVIKHKLILPFFKKINIAWSLMPIIIIATVTVDPLLLTAEALIIIQNAGIYNNTRQFMFNASVEHVIIFPTSHSPYPYRVRAWSWSASLQHPILIVVRQEKQVLSWQVPFSVDTTPNLIRHTDTSENTDADGLLLFRNTSRTLCHNNMDLISQSRDNVLETHLIASNDNGLTAISQSVIVGLSTSSPKAVNVFLQLVEERDFYVKDNVTYAIAVSPSEPRYVYYKFPGMTRNRTASATIVVRLRTEDDVCLTVSVQDNHCPIFDLEKDITHEGKYQTVNRIGGLTIRQRDFPHGFFLVLVGKANNFVCSQENSLLPQPSRSSPPIPISAINRTSIVHFRIEQSVNGHDYFTVSLATLAVYSLFSMLSVIMVWAFSRWGVLGDVRRRSNNIKVDEELFDETQAISRIDIDMSLSQTRLNVKNFAHYPLKDDSRSYNYLWHILSIAIFYSIPVVQLAITYQRIVNQSGNQDLCYYNFLCAHPAFDLSDYNHIFSNIGYLFTGVLLLIVVTYRRAIIPLQFEKGIPTHYGLFYAMGVALIIEGVLSACYHICPAQSNYQFDTSFMYVMAVLCMVKLYQNRHPDVNATAYATFTVLGVAIFLAMVGILNGSLTVWIVFVVIYSILCIYISFKVYFFSYVLEGLIAFRNDVSENGFVLGVFAPIRKVRFIVLLIANVINYTMLITGLRLYDVGATDFGTFLLGLLMANAVLHAIFYVCMKLVYKERICAEAICYGILGIICWITATVFFLDYAVMWTMTPAESRQWNQDCIFLNFYDKHDIWHLLSASALYFSFMFLLCLDDDLFNVQQTHITVF